MALFPVWSRMDSQDGRICAGSLPEVQKPLLEPSAARRLEVAPNLRIIYGAK
jgi:hypothetical protein